MTDQNQRDFFMSLLDQLGKLVVSSGIILALAYVAGWVYSWWLYRSLQSSWVMKFIEPQGFIKEGLPWIMYCTAVAALSFFSFRNSESMKGFGNSWMFLVGTAVIVLTSVSQMFGVNLETFPIYNSVLAFFLSLYAASSLAVSLRMLAEKKPGMQILGVASLGLIGTAVIFPFANADESARNLKLGGDTRPLVVDDKNVVQGVLVSAVGGKYLILDCKVIYQMTLVEPSAALKVRPSKQHCE